MNFIAQCKWPEGEQSKTEHTQKIACQSVWNACELAWKSNACAVHSHTWRKCYQLYACRSHQMLNSNWTTTVKSQRNFTFVSWIVTFGECVSPSPRTRPSSTTVECNKNACLSFLHSTWNYFVDFIKMKLNFLLYLKEETSMWNVFISVKTLSRRHANFWLLRCFSFPFHSLFIASITFTFHLSFAHR